MRPWFALISLLAALALVMGCGDDSGADSGTAVEVGACTDEEAFGIVSTSEDVQIVDCTDPTAKSEITLVGEDAEGPTACSTTQAHVGGTTDGTLVCIKKLTP